jgi:hypothetical protein
MRDIVEREPYVRGETWLQSSYAALAVLTLGSFFCAPRIFIAARHTCRMIKA